MLARSTVSDVGEEDIWSSFHRDSGLCPRCHSHDPPSDTLLQKKRAVGTGASSNVVSMRAPSLA